MSNALAWLSQHGLASRMHVPPPKPVPLDKDDPNCAVVELNPGPSRTARLVAQIDAHGPITAGELFKATGVPSDLVSALLKSEIKRRRIVRELGPGRRATYSAGHGNAPAIQRAIELLEANGYRVVKE